MKKSTKKLLDKLEGKKTILGAALLLAGSGLLPITLPVALLPWLTLAGTALGGAGIFNKIDKAVRK